MYIGTTGQRETTSSTSSDKWYIILYYYHKSIVAAAACFELQNPAAEIYNNICVHVVVYSTRIVAIMDLYDVYDDNRAVATTMTAA